MDQKELKALTRKWYAKLKSKGFEDIEQEDGNLKVWESRLFKQGYNAEKFKAKEEYYRMAAKFLNDHHFDSDIERFIWSQHAEGVSIRDIVKMLKVKGKPAYRFGVHKTIMQLKRLMFLGVDDV